MKTLIRPLIFIFFIATLLHPGVSSSKSILSMNVDSAILIDASTGVVLYQENSDKTVYPASTTKIMTAIIALENSELDTMMTASAEAVYSIGRDGMHVGISPGEQLALRDLLYALLVKSANEAANIIAENISGSISEYAELMNAKAKELGALNTNFSNPHGYHNPSHYTTASDMAKIARYAMTIPKFREIVSTIHYTIPPTNICAEPKEIYSTNKLFYEHTTGPSVFYPCAIGVKTGFTNEAGNNFVGAAAKDGVELISVVMGFRENGITNGVFQVSRQLLDYGISNYSIQEIVTSNSLFSTIKIENSKYGILLDVVTADTVKALMPNNQSDWDIKAVSSINDDLCAPIEKGDVIGHITYYKDDIIIGDTNLIANNSIELSRWSYLTGLVNNYGNTFITKVIMCSMIFLITNAIIIRPIVRRVNRYYRYKIR